MKPKRIVTLLWIAASLPAAAAPIDWHLYDAGCPGGAAAVEITCGHYGRFLLLQSAAPPGCTAIAAGIEEPPGYAPVPITEMFPVPARQLREFAPDAEPHPLTIPKAPRNRLGLPRGSAQGALQPAPAPSDQPLGRWIAVVDFDSAHGNSTTWLAEQVAGDSVTAALAPLQDPDLQVLGHVSDFHVLAKLCEIVNAVDTGTLPAPLTVNMSFGRPVRATDPTSGTDCPAQNAACQVGKVLHHLKGKGTYLVAAAGNHRDLLFPASLSDVLAAGMLDLSAYMNGGPIRPAWETPPDVDAWIPGNALCLRAWAAPAGSSYSSAMLAGWLVSVIDHPELLVTLGEGPWVPSWDRANDCFVLAKGRRSTHLCNEAITTLFNKLSSATPGECRAIATEPSLSAAPPGHATSPAPLPSIDNWGDPTHPAPESDPCVPCTATFGMALAGSDLQLDLSRSGALPAGIELDEVSLRVGDAFYELSLSATELAEFGAGTLSTLVLEDAGVVIPPAASISLWYRMKQVGTVSCSGATGCFWSSTPLMLEAE